MFRLKLTRHTVATFAITILPLLAMLILWSPRAKAAACAAPATDYGSVSNLSASVSGTGTYRIWTRMAAPDTTNNTYRLEIDGSSCYTVGGSGVPTYASGASTYFANNSTNWISKTSAGAQIDVSLSAGTHTFKMIGNAPNVVVDRLVMTQDTACVPTGTGDNCANPPDTTPPAVAITSPANNATISSTATVTANATDDVSMSKVEFYVDNVLKGTDTTGTTNNYTYSLNPTSFSVGAHTLTAKAYDVAGNVTSSSVVNITVADATAPTISAVASGSLTQTSATVTWTTNEASDSQVEYGPTTAYGTSSTLATAKVTSHSVGLSGLTASTTYHYQVKSKDAAGNLATSADATFTTAAPTGDTTKPTVSLTAPANGATVSATTAVTATASDNVGVAGVQFKLDGTNLGAEDTAAPYSFSWDTTTVNNGSHTMTAVARDAAGNVQTATTITVTVSNVTVTYRAEDINQDGSVNLLDFSLLSAKFGLTGSSLGRVDINQDGSVNLLDFSLLSAQFGT